MSTPSTATAALAPHQFYSQHQIFQPSRQNYPAITNSASRLNGYTTAASASTDLHRPASAASRHTNQLPPLRNTDSSSEMHASTRKKPDWNEFYRNGVPKEVIVIDDDDSPAPQAPAGASRFKKTVSNLLMPFKPFSLAASYVAPGLTIPSSLQSLASYSATQTPYNENTASTDRTTAAYNSTTAPTSLEQQAANGAYAAHYDDATAAVGQKRKRTRVAAEDTRATKRREVRASPYSDYQPPRKPPTKAKDVYVETIADRSHRKDLKVDDDDGHYMVTPDTDLTERCKFSPVLRILNFLLTLLQIKSSSCSAKAPLARLSRLGTAVCRATSPSKSSARCRSTVTPHESSCECSPRLRRTTRTTATSAFTSDTASTSATISASSRISTARVFSISSS